MRDNFNDDEEALDDDAEAEPVTVSVGTSISPSDTSSKAWREIERKREMKELRRHLDDFFFEDDPRRDISL